MLTVKLYSQGKTRIHEAGSVTVNHGAFRHELTLHDVPGRDDFRVDVTFDAEPPDSPVPYWESAIVENANGKTSEMLIVQPDPASPARPMSLAA